MRFDGGLGWILGLACASVDEDRREICKSIGWSSVSPGFRKLVEVPEDEELVFGELDIKVMRVCLSRLRDEDHAAWWAVAQYVDDLGYAPVDLARGARWLLRSVTTMLDKHR